jgi:hypothetical protein
LVFINTRHRRPSDSSHFRLCLPSPIHSACTSAVLKRPLINTKVRKRNCHWPSCIRSERDCTRICNPQKHYLHHKSVFRLYVPCAGYRRRGKLVAEMCFSLWFRNRTQKRDDWWRRKSSIAAAERSNVCIRRA